MDEDESPRDRVAILPWLGMGHLIPLAELARRLVLYHNFSVTLIIPSEDSKFPTHKAQHEILNTLPKAVDSILLPPPPLHDVLDHGQIRKFTAMRRSMPSVCDVLKTLISTTRVVAFLVDMFCTDAFDVAKELQIRPYLILPTSCMTLSLCLYLSTLDAKFSGEFRDMPMPLKLPGCVALQGKDLPNAASQRSSDLFQWSCWHIKRYKDAKGILVNSFSGLESDAITAVKEGQLGGPPVYPVGPLVQRTPSTKGGGHHGPDQYCLRWLDEQPRGSVLFVSFGSGGTLSSDQMHELALGLEMSGQRFLWVVKSPHGEEASETFSSGPLDHLPNGFIDRTKGVGLVVPSWAPQIQVLGHGSTRGFLSHCGWNSTLESILHGVPMIAWPLYAEQRMNAVFLVDDLKVALWPTANESGLVGKEEIASIVKALMGGEEGERLQKKMQELKDATARALAEEGDSYLGLSEVAHQWKKLQ